jgi:hypothetical protein
MNHRPQSLRSLSTRHARRPRRFVAWTAVLCALALASTARAQVFMNAQPVPLPSAYPADWGATHSLVRLLMTNSAGEPVRCDLRVRLEQNGDTAGVVVPRRFEVGPTFLQTPNVTDWSRLTFNGEMKTAMKRTGHLSAAPIRVTLFCENMKGILSGNSIPPVSASIVIVPSVPPPPTLLSPSDGTHLRATHPVFTWTPVRLTTGQEVWYQFRLVRVLPGQTANAALDADYAVLETFVHQSSFAYPPEAPRLENDALYAWRVQALVNASTDVNDVPAPGNYSNVGLSEGRSRVYSFLWQTPAGADAKATALSRVRSDDAQVGTVIGIGSDDRAVPPAVRADSLTMKSFAHDANWWGPGSAVRLEAAQAATLSPDGGATDSVPAEPVASVQGAPAVTASDPATPRPPIDVDTNTPQGAGFAMPWLRVSGTSVVAGELYSHTGAGLPSRPDDNGQLMAGVVLSTFNGKLNLPLQALVSGDQVSFRQSVNRVAVHPEWRWGGIHAGTINPGFSSFSLADASLLGGGADVVRGSWYVSVVDGRTQKTIRPDTVNAVEAQFARNVMAGRLGFGKPLGNAVEFEVMRARDDENSLARGDSLVRVAPAGNWVYGARARHTVLDTLTTVQVEGAWSRYDRNLRADVDVVDGGAGSLRIQRRSMLGEVGAAIDYVGGGFVTLCNSELAPDRVEGRLNARRDLMAGRLRIGGNVGLRRDDLSGTLGGATRRRIMGAQVGWQPASLFGADVDLGVLSSRTPGSDLRPELKELTSSFTLSPHLQWSWLGSSHTLTSSLVLQQTDYSGAAADGLPESRCTTVVAGWQSSVTTALFVNVSGNYIESKNAGLTSEIGSIGPGISMTMWNGRAMSNLQLMATQTHIQGLGTDHDLAPTIDLRYLVTGRQMLVFRAGGRRFRPAASAGNFEERLATLQYSAAL